MFRLVCILATPLCFMLASCDNTTQEARRWDKIYDDFASGAKVQPWKEAQDISKGELESGKDWN